MLLASENYEGIYRMFSLAGKRAIRQPRSFGDACQTFALAIWDNSKRWQEGATRASLMLRERKPFRGEL
jgi:hypothetical protein